jgi:hypothetical protein
MKLVEEQCELCEKHHAKNHVHDDDSAAETCEESTEWHDHFRKASGARARYREDAEAEWPSNHSVRSVDLQKVIMLPRLPGIKTTVFTKKLIAFHVNECRFLSSWSRATDAETAGWQCL